MAQYDNMIGSRGFSVAPVPYDSSQQYGRLGELAGQLVAGDPQAEYREAQTKNTNADTALKEQKLNQPTELANKFADLVAHNIVANPEASAEQMRTGIVNMYEQGIRSGMAPQQLSDFALSIAGLGSADNSTMMDLRAGTGKAMGVNDSLTEERQNTMRDENFAQQTSLNNADNATDITQTGMQQAGQDRRDNGPGGKPAKQPTLKFGDMNKINQEINNQTGNSPENPVLDHELQSKIRARTEELYTTGESPSSAVAKAISELTEFQPEVDTPWYNPLTRDKPAGYAPRSTTSAPPAGTAPATAAPVIRKFNKATGRLE